MINNVIDIIIYLMRRIAVGETLNEIKTENLKTYNRSEISAAYSWILQKTESGELDKMLQQQSIESNDKPHRILHFAERMIITPEAYGYLLGLVNIGLLDYISMEKIIEKVMLHSTERVTLDKIKDIVAQTFFEKENNPFQSGMFLKGNESIN